MDRVWAVVKAVIDTNVIAYLVLGTPEHVEESRRFFAALKEGWAPALWEAELANVLWMAARREVVSIDDAVHRLGLAAALGIHTVSNRSLWQGALVRAFRSGIAAYDTLFVELAVREKIPLATFDAGLLRAFPDVAARPAAILTAG